MRILGLGVDLADVERVGRVLEKYPRFAERCFTKHEREYAFRYALSGDLPPGSQARKP